MKKLLLLAALQSATLVAAQTPGTHLFYEDFATKNKFTDNWVVLDHNGDKKTWEYINETSSIDADGGVGLAKYTYIKTNPGDDFLTTKAPVALKAGTNCLSFYYRTSTVKNKESFEILYGTSKDVSTMKVLNTISNYSNNTWDTSINDFIIEEAGDYYFSFHVISPANQAGLWIDNIAIDEGGFQGNPDIALENLVLPASDCSLGSAPISVTVKNVGTAAINGFSLYYEIDGTNKVTQTFTDKIALGGSLSVQFTTPVDFSAIDQAYDVEVVANCDKQLVFSNDTIQGRVVNLAPTTAPFESSFKNAIDVLSWNPITQDGWSWNSASGCYKANKPSTLLSRCIHLTPGDYRIAFSYNAGDELIIGGVKYDYFYVAFGKSGSQDADRTKIKEFKANTQNTIDKKEIQFTVTEESDYTINFTSTDLAYLEIHAISVSKIADHDVKVGSFANEVKIPGTIPQYQINTAHKFKVSVVNSGKQTENNITLNIKGNDDVLTTTIIPALAVGEVKEETLDLNLTGVKSNKEQLFSFMAEANIAKDDYPNDNIAKISTMVSDSTYAWDSPKDFEFGVGNNSVSVAFGTTFIILKEDILTSLSIGFTPRPAQDKDRLILSVYRIDTGDSSMGQPLLRKEVSRGEGGKEAVYKLSDLKVTPGKYMFEVTQVESTNMGLVCDRAADGLITVSKKGFIDELPGYGYPYIRPNFSKNYATGIKGGATVETELKLYPNPASEAIQIKTNGSRIEKITIHNLLGQTLLSAIGNGTENQTVNINSLSSGTYLVVINTDTKVETIKLIVKQ